ncbi:MAG: S9 family peptidase [Rikenellaceae bacterium]|nr:S9 family peptidase [Rikenellaceae bacterium]
MKRYLTLLAAAVMVATDMFGFDYNDIARGKFSSRSVYGVRSMADGLHYTSSKGGKVIKYAYVDGSEVDTLYRGGVAFSSYQLLEGESKILLESDAKYIYRRSHTARYWLHDIASGVTTELIPEVEGKRDLSIAGGRVAFASENNLYVYTLDGKQLFKTTDGEFNKIINGTTDWVYEEEFGFTKAYALSPDAGKVAWIRFDESHVKEYHMNRFDGELYPTVYSFKYPKAGERNSVVELMVADLATGEVVRMDKGADTEYIARLGWTPSGELYFFRLNRLQNHFEVVLADADKSRVVYTETSPRYVDRVDDGTVRWLPDGDRFIVQNETAAGYSHLYLYSLSKGFLNAITEGEWEVTAVNAITKDRIYYTSTEGSPLTRGFYSVKLNGKGKKTILEPKGMLSVAAGAGAKYFLSYYTDAKTPNIVTLHKGSGEVIRVLEDNAALRQMIVDEKIPTKEFFTFENPVGVTLNGYFKKPVDFDPNKKYPVLMTQYSGPGSQQVTNSWSVGWEDVLVQNGYVVACVDGRGTGYRGEEFKKCTYRNLGKLEVEDQISAARYFGTLPWVDSSRIGIYGWSFGGFMALNCILKGADVFKMAIAVAPVTSWRYYDTIYTEVYNGLPQDNAEGYDDPSPINHADKLKGKLLICHGSADDNVHPQNAIEMVRALGKAGKLFDMMYYPDANHSMVPGFGHAVRQKMVDYTLTNL